MPGGDSDSIIFISDIGLICDGSQEFDFTFVNELPWGETIEEKANAESKEVIQEDRRRRRERGGGGNGSRGQGRRGGSETLAQAECPCGVLAQQRGRANGGGRAMCPCQD